jgi:hypothetical protein
MDDGGVEQECLSIAASVFDGVRRQLGVPLRLTFDNGGSGLRQWAWLFDGRDGERRWRVRWTMKTGELRRWWRCMMVRHQQKTMGIEWKTRWVAVAAVDAADEDSTKTTATTMATAAATTSDNGSNDDNGGNYNDETKTPTSTALKRVAQR